LEEQRQISRLEIDKFCNNLNCEYVEISVLQNKGIDELINKVVEKCLKLEEII